MGHLTTFPRRASLMPYQHLLSFLYYATSQHFSSSYGLYNHTHKYVLLPHNFKCSRACPFSSIVSQPFNKMPHKVQSFQTTNLNYVLDLIQFCTQKPDLVSVVMIHCIALKSASLAYLPTSTSLLILYSRTGELASSLALFDEIICKDVVIWNAVMTACSQNDSSEVALSFFIKMVNDGSGFDSSSLLIVASTLSHMNRLIAGQVLHGLSLKAGMLSDCFLCNAFIDMYAKCGDLSSSQCVFQEVECRDLVSWNSLITGCLLNNHPDKSIWYFREMIYCGKLADYITLSCVTAACTCLGDLDTGQVIQGFGIKMGYAESSHISVGNAIISLYSTLGDVNAAENVFKEMAFKDVVSWNAMIGGLASSGNILEAFQHLHQMQLTGSVKPNTVTILTIASLCAESILLREAKALHGFSMRREMGFDLHLTNSLVDLYSKFDSIRAAEYLFQTMTGSDLVTWNSMISGYSRNGHSIEAQNLFKELLLCCSKCTLSTLLAILPSCDSPNFLHFGKSIHCWQLKLGFLNNTLAINSLMFMYINCGDLRASLSLLWLNSRVADTACWNTIIAGCTRNNHFWEAFETFNLMRQDSRVYHDSITLVNVISTCGNLELVFEGRKIHGMAIKTLLVNDIRVQNALITMYGRFGDTESATFVFYLGQNHNLCSWNCMISAFSQNKDAKKALDLFRSLDLEPDVITIATALSACTQLGVVRHGKQIHAYVYRVGFQRNPYISAALVDLYSNCGTLHVAFQIFQNLPEKSVAAWNSMISAYGFHSNGQKAIEVFHEMITSGVSPTKSTFINLLSACSHSGLVNEGLWYYEHMLCKFGVEPVTEHHVYVVDMLGRSGNLKEAYKFVKEMPTPTQSEPGIWGALLSACNYHGDIAMGKEVANILFSLEPENVGYYLSLSNMFVAAGSWSNVVELTAVVHDKQLKKPAGYSLIDVGAKGFGWDEGL